MKIRKWFLEFGLFVFGLLAIENSIAQTTDSLKYENGFLYYHQYGTKNLPPVIILTGGPGVSFNQLEGMAITISTKFRAILLEQRGTGKSIPNPFDSTTINLNLVTKDLKKLMDKLNLKKSIFIGHSWGGALALNFATLFPKSVEHLVLIAPGPHKDVKNGFTIMRANRLHTLSFAEIQRSNKLNDLIKKNEADSLEIFESRNLVRRPNIYANPLPDSTVDLMKAKVNRKTQDILVNEMFKNFDVSKSLNNYKGQIDIISGRQDPVAFFSYELKQDRPNAKLHWINECGHYPMYEQPSEFYKILYKVLNAK